MITLRQKLDNPHVGFCLNSVDNSTGADGDKTVDVIARGFFTSDDGPDMYTYLDSVFAGFGSAFQNVGIRPEHIDNCLINIVDGTSATIWVNFPTIVESIAKGTVKAGMPATLDNIADARSVSFPGIEMPTKGAVVYTFQHGWRRGLYFDYPAPVNGWNRPLKDFPALAGSLHAALIFRERIQMKPDVLDRMSLTGWFPFIRLPHDLAVRLYRHFEEGWDHAPVESEIVKVVGPSIPQLLEGWSKKPLSRPTSVPLSTQSSTLRAASMRQLPTSCFRRWRESFAH